MCEKCCCCRRDDYREIVPNDTGRVNVVIGWMLLAVAILAVVTAAIGEMTKG